MKYSQCASEYKAQLSEDVYRVLDQLAETLDELEQKGRNAAQDGTQPLDLDYFINWVHNGESPQISELLFEVYMDGYNAGIAAV